jgi:hypothetical protein
MGRILAAVAATLLACGAIFFVWKSQAEAEALIPPAPDAVGFAAPLKQPPAAPPPAAPEKSKEEKRFARADKDDDGRITRAELLEPRRKPFAKLPANGDGQLSFEEWAVRTSDKFAGADADGNGALTPAEYATTRPKPRAKRCAC